jgi:hypothetical protein
MGRYVWTARCISALAFQKDLKDVKVHLLNTRHFSLEEDLDVSVSQIKRFLGERIN